MIFDYTYAAYLFSFLTAIVVMFQLALVLGVPWGEMAMGGKFPGQLPLQMRIAEFVQIVLLIFMALIVLTRAGLVFEEYFSLSTSAIWGVVVLCVISAILNIITPSKKERALWAPVAIANLLCVSYVAIS